MIDYEKEQLEIAIGLMNQVQHALLVVSGNSEDIDIVSSIDQINGEIISNTADMRSMLREYS